MYHVSFTCEYCVLIFSAFGVYYAYDKPFISINEGDFVNWSWETPAFVNDIAHSITEVESPSATVAKEGGFSSGSASRDGINLCSSAFINLKITETF
jgi:hypothetical protein